MGDIHVGHAVGKSGNITRVDFPVTSPLLDRLRALPDVKKSCGRRTWTAEEDAVLLEGRPRVGWGDLARLLECCEDTARERWRELVKEKGE